MEEIELVYGAMGYCYLSNASYFVFPWIDWLFCREYIDG